MMVKDSKKRIGILTGYWSTNIGNSFFQLGAEYALRRALPDADIFLIGDQQGYIKPKEGNPLNSFDVVRYLDIDYLVILGPFIRPEFDKILYPTLQHLHERGIKIIALGVGMMQYDQNTIDACRKLLYKISPVVFTTRDRITYDAFSDISQASYDGIDLAFFVSDLWDKEIELHYEKYIVFNFDQINEPKILMNPHYEDLEHSIKITVKDKSFYIKFSKCDLKLSGYSKVYTFVRRGLTFRQPVSEIFGYKVIRTDHRYNPVLRRKIYSRSLTYSGDVPYSYLLIYANAEAILSNRVHACVAALSFGNKAMLFSRSPRSYLLDRVGAKGIRSELTSIDLDVLHKEKVNFIEFLKKTL